MGTLLGIRIPRREGTLPPSLLGMLPERGVGGPGPMAQDLATFQKFSPQADFFQKSTFTVTHLSEIYS